jgi:hypothetical protein
MKKLLVLGMAVLMTACSSLATHYLKPGQPDLTQQDFDRDYKDCFNQHQPSLLWTVPLALVFSPAGFIIAEHRKTGIHDCMQARGYTIGDSGFKKYK